jgi:hypothetical protein
VGFRGTAIAALHCRKRHVCKVHGVRPVLIGFGSTLLAILFGAIFHFWRRERYLRERRAECLGLIEDCEKLIAEFVDRLPEILRSKNLTDQDHALFLRWNNVSKEIHASFSEPAVGRFAELDKLIAGYSSLQASEGFDQENFLRAESRAITSLCQDLGIDE